MNKSNTSPQTISHKARKRFGQNFLTNENIIQKIVKSINAKPTDNLIEIGPGKGAITEHIIKACPQLQVIELDRDLIPVLLAQFAKYSQFKIHQQDALKFDFSTLIKHGLPLRIIGNLPYNISTPLIFHLLQYQDNIKDMLFMLQKEVVQRLTAQTGEKHYGRLGIMVQYYCHVEQLFDVPPESFNPKPKVDSAIVRLEPYRSLPHVAENVELFSQLVNTAFQQRRKTLRNTLKQLIDNDIIATLPIDTGLRPENLSIKDFVDLSNYLHEMTHKKDTQ